MRYIIIPKYDELSEALSDGENVSTESRQESIRTMSERRGFEADDSVQGQIDAVVRQAVGDRGAEVISAPTTGTPITGVTIIHTQADVAAEINDALPDADVVPDEALELIPFKRSDAAGAVATNPTNAWHLAALGLTSARQAGFTGTGAGVTVGVLDTGIAEVPEIQGRVMEAFDLDIDLWQAKPMPMTEDTHGHGTHVAGLIAGKTVGVAPGAKLVNVLLIPHAQGSLSRYILALEWVASRPDIRIINMSAGRRGYSPNMLLMMKIMRRLNVLACVAVGNEGPNTSRSPGNYSEVLSVGACNDSKQVWPDSSGGQITPDPTGSYDVPKLVAPGQDVTSCTQSGPFEAWSGTSMATPLVTGMAALLLERFPAMTLPQLEAELLSACVTLNLPIQRQGKGMLTLPASLQPTT